MAETRELLFSAHPYLGTFLTRPPWKVFAILSSSSIVLFGPAFLIHVASIPLIDKRNLGILYSPHWSLPYILLLPLIFALFAWLFRLICTRLEAVLNDRVIEKKNGTTAKDYFEWFAKRFVTPSKIIFWLSIALAATFVTIDTAHLPRSVYYLQQSPEYQRQHKRPYELKDWTFAYAIPTSAQPDHKGIANPDDNPIAVPSWSPPQRWGNLAYDVIAWSFEAVYIFGGFFCVLTFGYYLKIFADSMIGAESPYDFNPKVGFSDNSLGLKPIGTIYNIYLSLIFLFGVIGLVLRLKYIAVNCATDFPSLQVYFKRLLPLTTSPLWNIAQSSNLLAFHCLNVPIVIFIVSCVFTLWVIIYLPMIRLKGYIRHKVNTIKQEKDRQLTRAKLAGDDQSEKIIRNEIALYWSAQVWPNGDKVAVIFLTAISFVLAGSISPAIAAQFWYLFASYGLWKLFVEAIFKKIVGTIVKG